MIGIYMIRNKINGKVYIGQSRNIGHRWRCHKYDLRHNRHGNSHLQHSYNLHPDAFEYKVILECKPEELNAEEERLIESYNACNPDYGYNIDSKANGTGKMSDETKKKLSENHKGRDWGHMRGRVLSASWRRHLSEAQPHKRAVICLETKHVYDSAFDVERDTGVQRCKVVSCCTGNRKTAGGYHWSYYDDYVANPEHYADILNEYVPTKSTGAKVICLDTGIIYATAREAARLLGLSPSAICQCLKGKAKTSGGYRWAYYDES